MKRLSGIILSVFIVLFALISCEIGLGDAVDIEAPVVNVTKPEAAESVAQRVTIEGTASDNIGVTSIKVTIEETKQSFKLDSATNWKILENNEWKDYEEGKAAINNGVISFSLPVDVEGVVSGTDVTIITQAFDEMGNEGKKSKDERLVTIDVSAPLVSLTEPVLFKTYSAAESKTANYALKDNSILSELYNQNVTISGYQKEDSKLDKLVVYVDSQTSAVTPEKEEEIQNILYKKEFTGTGLRNWSFVLEKNMLPSQIQTGKHLLRIVTYSYDVAGNCEAKVQGWFTYWNEADTPWLTANFGYDDVASASAKKLYPSCSLLGQAYDDDGLKTISIRTVLYDDTTNPATETEVPYLTKVINLDEAENPKYYAWSTYAISELGKFYVEVSCADVYGVTSESVKKYMDVDDVTPPTIKVTSSKQLPLNNTTFTISGSVIDDGGVKSVAIIRKSDSMSDEDEVLYLNGQSTNAWNFTNSNIKDGSKTENGHKIWILGDYEENGQTKTTEGLGSGNNTSDGIERSFSFSFDYSRDFNIKTDFTGDKLTSQSFIICAIDNQGLSRTQALTLNGDMNRPELTIDEVVVYTSYTNESTNTVKERKNLDTPPQLQPYNREGSDITDKVQLRGTWSDDSTYLKPIEISWADAGTITIHRESDGIWYTDPISPPDKTTAAIEATLEDLGENKKTVNTSFYVNGSVAQFLRITSNKKSGYFKAGEEIEFYLEFSKNVEFKGGSEAPVLVLSNDKEAEYISGNKTSDRHVFKYTVADGDDTTKLNVKSITTNGHIWYDGSNKIWNTSGGSSIAGTSISSNLAVNCDINIDTVKPYLKEIKTAAGNTGDSFAAGKTFYIYGTFSEEVTGNTVTGLKLKFNTGKESSAAKAVGPDTVLFTYQVQTGDNVNNLELATPEIVYGSTPTDRAGNTRDTTKGVTKTGFTNHKLDTEIPDDPVITLTPAPEGSGTTKVIYDKKNVKVSISFDTDETTGVKKFTTDYKESGTNIWSDYAEKSLGNGEYTIGAYQQDSAGNKSGEVASDKFKVDYGHILKSVSVDKPAGTYGQNEPFFITLKFRNNINVTNPKIKLNIGASGKEITGTSSGTGGTDSLTFSYTSGPNDTCNKLEVIDFTADSFTDLYGNVISDYVALTPATAFASDSAIKVENFASEKTIKIDSTSPTITDVSLEGQILRIVFSSPISKGTSGQVELKMKDTYRAPPYFTKEKWADYSGDSTVSTYYESDTNGCSAAGVADLTEKFVLKFDYDVTNTALTTALKNLDADKAKLSINSSDVTIDEDDSEGKTLKLDFGTKIPVKGATYSVTIPANLVYNSLNVGNPENTSHEVKLEGIEKPVIRIKKENETITGTTTVTITQPVTASARIDCQTPGSTITYKLAEAVAEGITMADSGNTVKLRYNNADLTKAPSHTFTYGTSNNYNDKSTFTLTAGTGNDQKGYQVRIQAIATIGTGANAKTETAYEQAMKTVIKLTNRGTPNGYKFRCIRGGDQPQGGVSTPNFPFSWNTTEYDKIRTMTGDGNTDGATYYWITWKLNTTAYVGFLAASSTMPSDANEKGPKDWWWASCGWVPDVANMPIYPGETTTCDANNVQKGKNGGFGFLDKHKQGR